jgi:hypothetical protein
MYKVTLTKVSGGIGVRTVSVSGICDDYPIVGEPFIMTAAPIDEKCDIRIISTSIVQSITGKDNGVVIETMNSTYHLVFE